MKIQGTKGFSLAELLIVIGVIGILLAISGPSVSNMLKRQRTDEVISILYRDFMYAKSEAMKRQNDVVMVFDAQNNVYSILYDENSDWRTEEAPGPGDFYLKQNVALPTNYVYADQIYGIYGVDNEGVGIGITFKDQALYFQPSGRISDDHEDTLDTLVKQNNRALYVIRKGDPAFYDYHHLRAIAVNGLAGQPSIWFYDYADQAWRTYD